MNMAGLGVREDHPCPAARPQELGVAAVDIKKLKEGGINTVESLAFASKRELCEIKGMSDAKVAKIKEIGEGGRAVLGPKGRFPALGALI